jgi:ribonuclease E
MTRAESRAMSKEIYISSTPHETRLAIVEKDELTEIYYERENEYTLAGSIYNGKVTRVLPGMQSSFVDIGLERDAFLYITDFMEEAGDSAEFEGADSTRAPREASQARETGPSREGRGDRGRGRRDGRPRDTQALPAGDDQTDPMPTSFDADDTDTTPSEASGEIGEGAPGADGSRRWRGRRGRRRGRGDAPRTDVATPTSGVTDVQIASPDFDEPDFEPAEFEASATANFEAPRDTEAAPRFDRGPRRERGGRGRDRDRGSRTDTRTDAPRERFAPRDESVDLSASAAPVEPFILPGESLSKYRRGEGSAAAEPTPQPSNVTFVTARPSTEVKLTGWDGGAVLPGETLRRRETPANTGRDHNRDRAPREERNDRNSRSDDGGSARRRDRDQQRGRESFRPQATMLDPAEAVQPAVSSGHDTAEAIEAPAFTPAPYETQPDSVDTETLTPAAEAAVEELHAAFEELHAPEFHETTTEYEPGDDASASYRVDPAGPSEFRQSSSVAELDPPLAEEAFTHIQPGGEMLSEVAEPVEADAHADAPIEHEGAIQSVTLREVLTHDTLPHVLNPADAQGFAPGDGQLEEELLDDDDLEPTALHAGAFDDDIEEETLENAADLGSMIRDMTIDDLTAGGPATDEEEDDEDDFDDEEDFEEDELASNGEEEEDDELSGSEISEAEEDEFAEAAYDENGEEIPRAAAQTSTPHEGQREGHRRGRRDGRRGRDRGDRNGSDRNGASPAPERAAEPRSERSGGRDRRGMANSRYTGGSSGGGGGSRRSVQSTNLPAISDLLKPGQEVLVQIAKEPIAKKGARITSHIALPGRFLVFMPTVSHTGVSRKIESVAERRRLKEILLSERGEATGGFIVRTAAAGASEEELRSDLRFLLNLWTDIKARSESSKSPALIYHDLNLIERILRDQVTDNFSAIWCDTEAEYERVLRFLQRFQPSLIRRVKLYTKDTPLFEQFGITEEINKALRSKVWLKSGGSIVINQTEALVAIDINTGKFVGKTTKLEDTIVKTNLDAIPEIVRQIRLRDLGGIIIIDFIDMDERKNRNKVMAALEEELKKDRAPSKVLQFNDFGLVAITRKRVKQSLERTLSTTCAICQGTGMTKSPVTICNDIYIEMRKMHKLIEKGDIMLRVNPEVVKQLKSGGKWLQEMEEMSGKTILVKSDPSLHPEQFDIH